MTSVGSCPVIKVQGQWHPEWSGFIGKTLVCTVIKKEIYFKFIILNLPSIPYLVSIHALMYL